MRRSSLLALVAVSMLLRLSAAASAQSGETLKPADCMADAQTAVATADYGGKTYYFKNQACREQFLTDPERYSQLYDALAELKNAGKPLQKPKPLDDASSVPS